MSRLRFSLKPPSNWAAECIKERSLLYSPTWHQVLQKGLGCKTWYAWDEETTAGVAISVFHVGPFRIGYLGFPIGGILNGDSLSLSLLQGLQQANWPERPHLLRLPVSAFAGSSSHPPFHQVSSTPETAIIDLPSWDLNRITKLRRDINKAMRSNFELRHLREEASSESIYNLYQSTVKRHSGNMRYTQEYFDALLKLTLENPNIYCLGAFKEEKLAGFLIAALNSKTAYYLHGAIDTNQKKYGASDWLLYHAIRWAQTEDMNCFNFMSSPSNQIGLVRYKEKFNAITCDHKTYEIIFNSTISYLFKIGLSLGKTANKLTQLCNRQ